MSIMHVEVGRVTELLPRNDAYALIFTNLFLLKFLGTQLWSGSRRTCHTCSYSPEWRYCIKLLSPNQALICTAASELLAASPPSLSPLPLSIFPESSPLLLHILPPHLHSSLLHDHQKMSSETGSSSQECKYLNTVH